MTVAAADLLALGEHARDQRLCRIRRAAAIRERLQRGDEKGCVRLADAVEDRVADDRKDVLDLRHRRSSSSMRRAASLVRLTEAPSGNCTETKNAPWSSSGRKPVGVRSDDRIDAGAAASDRDEAKQRHAHQPAHDRGIAVAHIVDPPQYPAHRPAPRAAMTQKHCAQRRRQRQRVHCRNQHRDADRHRELAEQLAGNARNEGDRHEHRQQHQRDRDDRRGDLGHRLLGCLGGRKAGLLLHDALDVLDDDDRVIDQDADCQHHREQRDGIGRISHYQQHREGADHADRHRDGRDQRRAQAAEKNEDDDDDQREGLDRA